VTRISHVINYDIPDTAEAYTHRIGRTGRAARTGDAFTLVTDEDGDMVRTIERVLGAKVERRTLQGFDYSQAAPSRNTEFARPPREPRSPRPARAPREPQPQGRQTVAATSVAPPVQPARLEGMHSGARRSSQDRSQFASGVPSHRRGRSRNRSRAVA
jgi:ATP-dependent RNA helicase RhlE